FFAHEVFAGGGFVTFVEEQVERLQNAIEPPRQLVADRNLEWNLRFLDFLFRARQSLGNRHFGRQECMTDFRHAEAEECFQRQRFLHYIFRQVPVFDPENSSQRRHHYSRLMTEEMLDQLRHACWFLHGSFSGIALPYARYSERQYATWLMRIFDQHDRFDIALHMQAHPTVKQQELVEPERFKFKDDGVFPNSDLPLLLYRQAFSTEAEDRASVIEQS